MSVIHAVGANMTFCGLKLSWGINIALLFKSVTCDKCKVIADKLLEDGLIKLDVSMYYSPATSSRWSNRVWGKWRNLEEDIKKILEENGATPNNGENQNSR